MKVYQLLYQQHFTRTIYANSLEEADQQAKQLVHFNPTIKLLSLTEYEIAPYAPPQQQEPQQQ